MNVRSYPHPCVAKRHLPSRASRTLARLAGLILLATSVPLVSEAAAASGIGLDARSERVDTQPRPSPELAMQGTARCDDAIQLPDGWTCHRGRSYRLYGLRLALRETRATQAVQ
ncbi:MAG: hypothetical protein JW940_19725 [Polyangiaceae bacterium]|nr:hypothetical protein [Polyangiaceae bacterium]